MEKLIESWCHCFPDHLVPDASPEVASPTTADPYSAGPSTEVEQYCIRRIVGSGSSGTALIGRRVRDSLSIIAKVLDLEEMDERQRQRTRSEIHCLSQCSHPSIIQYLSHHEQNSKLLVVMELADAGDMGFQIKHRRERNALFLEQEAAFMMTQIFLAIDYVHSQQILHRDIKPANVFVKENGIVKVGDFGLSRMFEESVSNPVADSLVGTPYYIAPEVWKQEKYGKKADLFSIGVVWYEMLTLERPFRGSNIPSVKKAILSGSLPNFSRELSLHPDTVELITSLLDQDPNKRPSIMDVFLKPIMEHSLRIFSTIIIQSLVMSEQAKSRLQEATKTFREKLNHHFQLTYHPKLNLDIFGENGDTVFVSNLIFLDEGRKWKHRSIRLSKAFGLEIGRKGTFDVNNADPSSSSSGSGKQLQTPAHDVIRTVALEDICKVSEVPRCLTENRDFVFAITLFSDEALWFYSVSEPHNAFDEWTKRMTALCGLPESFKIVSPLLP